MSFRAIDIAYSYETGHDDLVNDFYVPLLAETKNYDRIAGFFTSASLAIAARGIAGLIKNKGTMRIIACPHLDAKDTAVIQNVVKHPEEYISQQLLIDLEKIEDDFQLDHIRALGWMLGNGYLEMKIALVRNKETDTVDNDSLFHQKIGIMTDIEGNRLSFSGSINETAAGWLTNIEEFKVFRGWELGQDSYLDADVKKFEDFWNGLRPNVIIKTLPKAVSEKLIIKGIEFSREHFIAKRYLRSRKEKTIEEKLNLFPYQKEAFEKWKNNKFRLLFEMATGTGKTRTAIACINYFLNTTPTGLVIISCPQSTLSLQWKEEIDKTGLNTDSIIIADGSHTWRDTLKKDLKLLALGFSSHTIVYTTHTTASSEDFTNTIIYSIAKTPICFIGDEAHGLGAYKLKLALLEEYSYRIGLSATPSRWFDDYGSKILSNYFGNDTYKFTIAQALTTINPLTNKPFLVEYEYHPVFISLTDDELEKYQGLSSRIKKMAAYSRNSDKYQSRLQKLLFDRADIEKNAVLKFDALTQILECGPIDKTLIFASDDQIVKVISMLQIKSIMAHRFTQHEGTTPEQKYGGLSERQYLINKFKDGTYKALVAIKCLDEGIDIPTAHTAIIMASSTNPREYIQRIGRVIRQSKEKDRAYIYDFILEPDFDRLKDKVLIEFEKQIFEKELIRVKDMSMNSINNVDVLVQINERIRRMNNASE
jgi:superfamily II DNA or RNA helicase